AALLARGRGCETGCGGAPLVLLLTAIVLDASARAEGHELCPAHAALECSDRARAVLRCGAGSDALLRDLRRPRAANSAAGDGAGDADGGLARELLPAAGRPRAARGPLRQPRHRPLHAPAPRDAYIAHMEALFAAIGSHGLPRDLDDIREMAATSYDRDRDPNGPLRQLAAILAAGDRTRELHRITAPTLVIHGTGDRLV